jgi:hypothetical protein
MRSLPRSRRSLARRLARRLPRRLDVLTLGLSAQSRWNPLYRWWARRTVERNIVVVSKALMLRLGLQDGQALELGPRELLSAATCGALMEPTKEGGIRLTWHDEPTTNTLRILWGRR